MRIMTMTYPSSFNYFDDLPALIDTKTIAQILFGKNDSQYCQKVRVLVKDGLFPEPTIPSKNQRGNLYWKTPVVLKWYMEKDYEQDNSVTGFSNLNTD